VRVSVTTYTFVVVVRVCVHVHVRLRPEVYVCACVPREYMRMCVRALSDCLICDYGCGWSNNQQGRAVAMQANKSGIEFVSANTGWSCHGQTNTRNGSLQVQNANYAENSREAPTLPANRAS